MNSTMTYEQLYNNMVKKFTVENDNIDYKLGDYMLMKAKAKKTAMITAAESSNLPVARENKESMVAAIFTYVNDKLKVKEAPVRDKTMRSFPLRTSLTSFASALVVCALVVSCVFFGAKSSVVQDGTVATEPAEENEEEKITEDQDSAMISYEIE